MSEQVKIIDQFLTQEEFDSISGVVLSGDFPWYFNNDVNGSYPGAPKPTNDLLDYQFTHLIYFDEQPTSSAWELVQPIIRKINRLSLVRVKFNLNPVWVSNDLYGFHTDIEQSLTSGIFYLNDNDGVTEFADGSVVEARANRLVVFPSNLNHSGRSTTDTKRRVVLNLVWIPQHAYEGNPLQPGGVG